MNHITKKLTICAASLLAFLPGSVTRADEGKRHHSTEVSGRVVSLPLNVRCHVAIVSAETNAIVADVATDSRYRFEVSLKPGTYFLTPIIVNNSPLLLFPPGAGVTLKVGKKEIERFRLVYAPVPQ